MTGPQRLFVATCRVLALYGEEVSSGATNNYLGRMYRLYDSAGSTRTTGYDHQGHPLGVEKQLARFTAGSTVDVESAALFDLDPDWTGVVGESLVDLQDLASDQLELLPSPTGTGDLPTRVETYVSSSAIDALGRPTEVREAVLHGVTAPPKTAYTYDRAGAVAGIRTTERDGTSHPLVTYLEHNARGQRTRLERHDGQVATSYAYDPHSFRLTRMETTRTGSSPATLQDLNYWYDAGGNITRIEDDSQQTVYFGNQAVDATRVYTYDALYRLTSGTGREHAAAFGIDPSVLPASMDALPYTDVALTRYKRDFEYDAAGNMTKETSSLSNAWSRVMTVETNSNRLVSASNSSNFPTAYTFTAASDQYGQMLAVPGVDTMRWDAAGNMRYSTVYDDGSQRVWYVYGSDNQRVRKIVEQFVGSTWELDRETRYLGGAEYFRSHSGSSVSDERETVHAMDGDRRVAMLETPLVSAGVVQTPKAKLRHVLDNHLRSASVEVDGEGDLISYEEFHPYGTTAFCSEVDGLGVAAKRYRYTGKERDAETGLYYYGFRYGVLAIGRWLSPDPIGSELGPNLYRFNSCSPCSRVDRDGRQDELAEALEPVSEFSRSSDGVVMFSVMGFEHDSASIPIDAAITLSEVAAATTPESMIVLIGTTDSTGTMEYNLELSGDRMESVAGALAMMGVAPDRIRLIGVGEAMASGAGIGSGTRDSSIRGVIVVLGEPGFTDGVPSVPEPDPPPETDELPSTRNWGLVQLGVNFEGSLATGQAGIGVALVVDLDSPRDSILVGPGGLGLSGELFGGQVAGRVTWMPFASTPEDVLGRGYEGGITVGEGVVGGAGASVGHEDSSWLPNWRTFGVYGELGVGASVLPIEIGGQVTHTMRLE